MKNRQRQIYEDFPNQNRDDTSKIEIEPKTNRNRIRNFFKKIPTSYKALAAISVGAVVVWNFAGQVLLPHEYRFSTFIGNRIGDVETATSQTSLPQEQIKAARIASEQAVVEAEKSCFIQRSQLALQTYYDCSVNGGTEYLCAFRREGILSRYCPPLVATQLQEYPQEYYPPGE